MARASGWNGVAVAVALGSSLAHAQTTERASVATGGAQGNFYSVAVSISGDARYVAFQSAASNLVASDTNGTSDVFVRDVQAGTTELGSMAAGGIPANYGGSFPSISADGRFLAFQSFATNLDAGDTNGNGDVFVRDLQLGTVERVSRPSGPGQGDDESMQPAISADGRFVAFVSRASNLVAGDSNGSIDVFVRDRQNGTTERVSVSTGGAQANQDCVQAAISADGRFVAFDSTATNLVAGDTNNVTDVFVRDRQLGTTERVSVTTAGAQVFSPSGNGSISADGRFVAFESLAVDLVAADTDNSSDIFLRDRRFGTTVAVALEYRESRRPSISADARFVAFDSIQLWFPAADTVPDIFVNDRQTGTTTQASVDPHGMGGNSHSIAPAISADGRFVAFDSLADNLVPGDTNFHRDVFVRESGSLPPAGFCSGDGTAAACPCTSGYTGAGCPNSTWFGGAHLGASGRESLSADSLVLSGVWMTESSALYFQGTTRVAGGAGAVFGDGLRCVGGNVLRLGTKVNVNGRSWYPGPGDPPISVRGLVTTPGVRTYQIWYRNAASFCTPATFNLTNGYEVTWLP